ncbi:MAG TPA: hypothetical protein PLM79_09160 [Syntrophobacteraceae bacterium]|mgnify:CR=1 FL=1|nr:hypothetical protein [Syntrophobacteraceae bacterium]
MDFDRAMRVFRLYCKQWKENPVQAESLLWTEEERLTIREIKDLIKECAGLFEADEPLPLAKAV